MARKIRIINPGLEQAKNKKDIFNFFDEKGYSTKDFGAILKMPGYTVKYNSDGTLTAY